jgi:uncharacterized protein
MVSVAARLAARRIRPGDLESLLQRQLESARAAAEVARTIFRDGGDTAAARRRVATLEHQGDEARSRLVTTLSSTLAPALDREDVFRISRAVDDVLDNLRDLVRQWDLFRMEPSRHFDPLLAGILAALQELYTALSLARRPTREMTSAALRARKASNRVRHAYGDAMAALLAGPPGTPTTVGALRAGELLRGLDGIGTRIAEAADVLTDAAVKRSVL